MFKITIKLDTCEKIKSFARKVTKFESDVYLYRETNKKHRDFDIYNAKSILSVFVLLDMVKPVDVQLVSSNEDEILKFLEEMKEFMINE